MQIPLLLLCAAAGAGFGSQVSIGAARMAAPGARAPGRAPRIEFSDPGLGRASGVEVNAEEELRFRVAACDPEGDAVTLRLRNPLPGLVFHPVHGAAGAAESEVRWRVPRTAGGLQHLQFEAVDAGGRSARATAHVRVTGLVEHDAVRIGDLDGDGALDVVAGARLADAGGRTDAGAVYVWLGHREPVGAPDATLVHSGGAGHDRLGEASGQGIQLGDVNGDGRLDVVVAAQNASAGSDPAPATGAVYVWFGAPGFTGTREPSAILVWGDSDPFAWLGSSGGQGVQLVDVTGDGVLDVVAGAPGADVRGVPSAGAVALWAGGPQLAGRTDVTSLLAAPDAAPQDRLGSVAGQPVIAADVTGDGVRDVVAISSFAGGLQGRVYVWPGRGEWPELAAPTATLSVSQPTPMAPLGQPSGTPAPLPLQVADVSGDGVADVLAAAPWADANGVASGGGVLYVWLGGAALAGDVTEWAALTVPGASFDDRLTGSSGRGFWTGDVTGDGVLDVVAGAQHARIGGVTRAGAVYAWAGGGGLGALTAPTATLTVPGAQTYDALGSGPGQGVRLVDVTGDGVLDVVAATGNEILSSSVRRVHVWTGGAGLVGDLAPTATLRVTNANSLDGFGDLQFADLDGDGVEDVVTVTPAALVPPATGAGSVQVWRGGASLVGDVLPWSRLRNATPSPVDQLGRASGLGVLLADLTGDGRLDVLALGYQVDAAAADAGELQLWTGGPGLAGTPTPVATLAVPDALAGDQLGLSAGQALQVADADGDGWLDAVVGARFAEAGGVQDAGAIYLWRGGPVLAGATAPDAALAAPDAVAQDFLGLAAGQGIALYDRKGTAGELTVLGVSITADRAGVVDAGALFAWPRPLAGPAASAGVLEVPGAAPIDRLGW